MLPEITLIPANFSEDFYLVFVPIAILIEVKFKRHPRIDALPL